MTDQLIKTITACRLCGSKNLEPVFSLHDQYVVNFPETTDEQLPIGPLDVVLCDVSKGGCGLLQLRHTFSQDMMYQQYWYRSGVNTTMKNELADVVSTIENMLPLTQGDHVIDIGSNDSTLLRFYKTPGVKRVGFEPAKNLAEKYGMDGVDKIIIDYFNLPKWRANFGEAKAKAITAIAMFYDLDDPNSFVADIAECLDKDGVFVVQQNYLPYMLERNVIDNVAHEHLEYYSLTTFGTLMERHGLEVFDVRLNFVNGGSMRTYIRHKDGGRNLSVAPGGAERVAAALKQEEEQHLNDKATYDAFIKRVFAIRDELVGFLEKEKAAGKTIYVYGASTRGNSLMQCFGIDHRLITAAAEKNPDKWGRATVGTNIPIISEEQARAEKPDYFLVLPWQFIEEFKQREIEFLRGGGKFIVPLPKFLVIDYAAVSSEKQA